MTPTTTDYQFSTYLDLSFEEATETVTALLKEEGFGILTEIDVQATLKKKLDVDFGRYVILGACNPGLAHRALNSEREIGLLLPCNVIVYESEEEEGTYVSLVDPMAMLGVVRNPALDEVAGEARTRLERVAARLGPL